MVDLARAAAENVLIQNCGSCHDPWQAAGGIGFVRDVDQLAAAGLIVPLNSAASRVVQVMRDGSMPPPSAGLPPVAEADIEVVAQYIDNPRFWAGFEPPLGPEPDAGAPAQLVDAGPDSG